MLQGEADDLNAILPQLRFYNIFADYLGTDGWAHPDRLSRSREFLNGAVFASPEYHHPDNQRWTGLLSEWRKQYAGEPDIVAARTFDAVMLAATLLAEKQLSSGAVFEGASGTIEFSAERENIRIPLHGYYNDRILPIEKIPRPDSTSKSSEN